MLHHQIPTHCCGASYRPFGRRTQDTRGKAKNGEQPQHATRARGEPGVVDNQKGWEDPKGYEGLERFFLRREPGPVSSMLLLDLTMVRRRSTIRPRWRLGRCALLLPLSALLLLPLLPLLLLPLLRLPLLLLLLLRHELPVESIPVLRLPSLALLPSKLKFLPEMALVCGGVKLAPVGVPQIPVVLAHGQGPAAAATTATAAASADCGQWRGWDCHAVDPGSDVLFGSPVRAATAFGRLRPLVLVAAAAAASATSAPSCEGREGRMGLGMGPPAIESGRAWPEFESRLTHLGMYASAPNGLRSLLRWLPGVGETE
mmetsp:Transcript_12437/g.29212  ORF Transcript_12437/g.29212 Transcript_12437/m.29212 type:complete len:315 (-) Transcript_12437:488-1432(-)